MNTGGNGVALTPLREDLLRATFAVDETALTAWRRWREAIDWEAHLDREAFRLMPRTCRNLSRLGVSDPLLPRLKGIARRAWYENQRRARWVQPAAQALVSAGVELLLVPPASVLLFDATTMLDPDAPLACAVRGEHAAAAIHCLWRQGWRTSVRLPRWSLDGYLLGGERLTWRDPEGHALDLLWQWDPHVCTGRFPSEVWERSRRSHLAAVPVLTLDATDAVHNVCRQPLTGDPFARIVDCVLLVDAMPAAPDWARLFNRAEHAPLDPGWREYFIRLRAVLPHMFPAAVAADWPSRAMRPEALATGSLRSRLAGHWAAYREALGARDSLGRAFHQLPGYLLARWNLPALNQIPMRFGRGLRYEWREARRTRHRAS